MTEKTEGSKSAIMTAARGLNIDKDTAQYIASFIESDRGQQRSLKETYYGDEEKDFPPNRAFQIEMEKYPELWQVSQKIEGLVCGISSHAGGVNIYDTDITDTNSVMRLNSGEVVTAFDLHKSEECGDVKIDLLATDGLTRIREALNLLVENGYVEKKETLKETYENALGVYQIDRESADMWDKLAHNKILNAFQFDTSQGIKGLTLGKPSNVEELAALNSIIRLMAPEKGAEQPLEKYARFKENPTDWDKEMDEYHLTSAQKELLHKYLGYEYGICASQEDIMSMIQDPQIGGWSLKDADRLRKSIAKKNAKLYEELSNDYFKTVEEKKLDKNLCEYFWGMLVNTQRGYSFNASHTLAYSLVCLQEMNLATKYPPIFWNTANLIVDSAGADDEEEEKEDEEVVSLYEEENQEDYEYEDLPDRSGKVKRVRKTVNYGKTAASIGKFKTWGISVTQPDINHSGFTFTPDVETNTIMYGLRGITNISSDLISDIIANRPYTSFKDFETKNKLTKPQMVNLIKSGAFDRIENTITREQLMMNYLSSLVNVNRDISIRTMNALIENDLIPKELEIFKKVYCFNTYLKENKDGENYHFDRPSAIDFFTKYFDSDLIIDGEFISQKVWDKAYKKFIEPLKNYLKDNKTVLAAALNNKAIEELKEKYASGNISHWEMDSISFYCHEHELSNLLMVTDDFYKMSAEPVPETFWNNKKTGAVVPIYSLSLIAGTVINKNKMKNTITLLTKTGIVNVKVYKNQFAEYDKTVKKDGHIIDGSWFKKGTLLIVQGMRREDEFVLKKYKSSVYPVITKINKVNDDGSAELIFEKAE